MTTTTTRLPLFLEDDMPTTKKPVCTCAPLRGDFLDDDFSCASRREAWKAPASVSKAEAFVSAPSLETIQRDRHLLAQLRAAGRSF